jgi:hypothetical protein
MILPVPVAVAVAESVSASSFSEQEKTVRTKMDIRIMYKIFFIFFLHQ